MTHPIDNLAAAAAAPGVERVDVEAVNKEASRSLYKKRVPVHPKRVWGTFRKLKWVVMAVTLGIYYLVPWIRWDRGPSAPDQAVLIDFPGRRFYFFFIEIWPQEVYYLTGLLILAALGIFLAATLAGRVWCGYSCPQTVWTDLYVWVERLVEGDRSARMRLDKAPWSADKFIKRVVKHAIWLLIAVATGGAWVFYFADAPTLAGQLLTLDAPTTAYLWIAIFTTTTYVLGGHAREQVCIYMCPWPRIQAALIDEDSLAVTYRTDRGEPRGAHKKGDPWEGRGHCIDCNQCVAACPMGIDIRDGLQLECIQCALCIDACDTVMNRVDLPHGLIGYDTDNAMRQRATDETPRYRLVRPRTLVYAALIALVGCIMLYAFSTRAVLELGVQRDRNPMFTTLSDGSVRNGYTVKILNMLREERTFVIALDGLENVDVKAVGIPTEDAGSVTVHVDPDSVRAVRLFLTVPAAALSDAQAAIDFVVTDTESGTVARHDSFFVGPDQ